MDDLDVVAAHPSSSARRRLVVLAAVALVATMLGPMAGGSTGAAVGAPAAPAGTTSLAGHADTAPAQAVRTAKRAKAKPVSKKVRQARAKARAKAARLRAGTPTWRGGTLRYYDALPERWGWSLRTAVEQWNTSGVALRLVEVQDPARAQVRVSHGTIGTSAGLATLGRTQGAFVKLARRYAAVDATDPYYRVEVMAVLTHELGHVLGLGHVQTPCTLMGPVMDIARCGIYDLATPEQYRCGLVGGTPARRAVRLYGGTVRAPLAGSCPVGGPRTALVTAGVPEAGAPVGEPAGGEQVGGEETGGEPAEGA